MRTIRNIKFHLVILSVIMLYSCSSIKEDMSGCYDKDLLVQFKFDYHMGDNDFDDDIDIIGMYIFDAENQFVNVMSVKTVDLLDGNLWSISADYKGSTAVVWAGLDRSDGHFIKPVMNVGDDISKLILALASTNNESVSTINPLFWGGQEVLTFTENDSTTQIMTLLRNNNLVNLSVVDQNSESLDFIERYVVNIQATNAKYKSDNDITTDSPKITYFPIGGNTFTTDTLSFSKLRFVERYSDDVVLRIYDKMTNKYIQFEDGVEELKLIDHLSKSTPIEMEKQEYLDRESIWDISFTVNTDLSVVVKVVVNDWVTYIQNEDL